MFANITSGRPAIIVAVLPAGGRRSPSPLCNILIIRDIYGGGADGMARTIAKASGFTALDAAITLCLIGILMGVVIPRYERVAKAARETALRTELTNIRTGIKLFRLLNRRNPVSLKEMVERNVILPGRIGGDPFTSSIYEQKYLMHNAVDEEGNILDSFGNKFEYDPKTGGVRTTTEGYEAW